MPDAQAVASPSASPRDERTLAAWRAHLGTDALDPDELVAELTAGSLPEAFAATARERCDAPALRIDDREATHAELDDAAGRVAGWLRAEGVLPGDRVLLAAPTSMELVAAYLGTLRAGATAVPTEAAMTRAELDRLVADADPAAAFASGDAHAGLAAGGRPARLVQLGGQAPWREADPLPAEPVGAPAMLAFTSGTTGAPKGVPLTHANVLSSIRAVMRAWRWSADDVLVHALPLSHQHGLGGVHVTLLAGSRAVVLSRFDPEAVCRAVREQGGTVLFAVPAMYERLDAASDEDRACLRALRLAVSGSAALPPRLARRVEGWLGQLPLERYGSTEAGLDLSNLYEGPRRPGRVGRPLPGVEVRLDGETGEILVRGPQVFAGYLDRDDATAEAFTRDGFFRTGDAGAMDAEGDVEITGRLKDMIISGGLNVYPREVELVLAEHASVGEVAVAGLPSERWGEEVVAFVVPASDEDLDEDALLAHARERLSAYKCPKRVVRVGELPVNHMGKVQRDRLVALGRDIEEGRS